ncbi:hypothetical protein POM88_050825 [Heracleum sosnowskyi]|uniref:Transposase n=1 Tax=Heracleum sosnowskyi TaxID=360622 RepID=A0AAD8H0L7_9APIA|nr:hypothetical protein POM88_050825 [Heracleum sosnowskyi]
MSFVKHHCALLGIVGNQHHGEGGALTHAVGRLPIMPPGRRTTRSIVRNQQEIPTKDTDVRTSETKANTHSDAKTVQPTATTTPLPSENNNNARSNRKVNPRKATRGMGTSKIAKAAATGKLSVIFDADCRQPICRNAERFNNEIGFIVRNHGTFCYKDWRLVPEEVRAPLRNYLLENFDIDLRDKTTILCIDDQMRKAWRTHKYKLHSYFKSIRGIKNVEMAKKKRHSDLNEDQQEDWEILCDRWCSDEFKERAATNTINRFKRPWESKNGSVSTARHHIRRGMELTSSTGQIETWRLKHFDENGWTGPDLQNLYDKMMDIRQCYSPEEMSDKEIMETVLGRHSVYLRGWGRSSGTTNNETDGTTIKSNQPSYEELVQRLNEATNRLDEVVNVLCRNNLMPQPNTSPTNEDLDANLDDLE